MATRITQEQIIELNELYLTIGTYSGVSKAMGGSPAPSTVKKYIIPNYVSQNNIQKKVFNEEIKIFNSKELLVSNLGDLCLLSLEEEKGIKELWKELLL